MSPYRIGSPARTAWLGSARHGTGAWWLERLSALALLPLALWFFGSLIAHAGLGYDSVLAWLRVPYVGALMVLLLIALFYHLTLGLQVIIEDYIHSGTKWAALIALRLAAVAFAVIGVWAVLRISFRLH